MPHYLILSVAAVCIELLACIVNDCTFANIEKIVVFYVLEVFCLELDTFVVEQS